MAQTSLKLNTSTEFLAELEDSMSPPPKQVKQDTHSTKIIPKASLGNLLEALGIPKSSPKEFRVKRAVSLKNVVKAYGDGESQIHALQDVTLDVNAGEIVTVMGPSGSGKSTLLNLLGAMDDPTSGTVEVDGLDITRLRERDLASFRKNSVGFIFQDFYLIPNLSVLDNVLTPLIPYGITKQDKQRALDILGMVGLRDRAKSDVNKLSGGQKQRIAIARSLINDPNIILADEPTGNLDSETGRDIVELLINLAEQGKTVIIVTHDPRIGHLISETPYGRNIWMEDGQINENPTVNGDCW